MTAEVVLHEGDLTLSISPADTSNGRRLVRVTRGGVVQGEVWTRYSSSFIASLSSVVGFDWVCDQIERDENYACMEVDLEMSILGYVSADQFAGKRVLDFGCGTGASTAILSRMLPGATLVGTELDERRLDLARKRMEFIGDAKVEFHSAPSGTEINPAVGQIDYIIMSAVFEHMLPAERAALMPKLWSILNPGGVLFLNQTPDIRFPIETHTTGLPLINYFPKFLAHRFAQLSPRVAQDCSWESLLRTGLRGASPSIVLASIGAVPSEATLLRPCYMGFKRQSEIWYAASKSRAENKHVGASAPIIHFFRKLIDEWLHLPIAPYLSLAIKKVS